MNNNILLINTLNKLQINKGQTEFRLTAGVHPPVMKLHPPLSVPPLVPCHDTLQSLISASLACTLTSVSPASKGVAIVTLVNWWGGEV